MPCQGSGAAPSLKLESFYSNEITGLTSASQSDLLEHHPDFESVFLDAVEDSIEDSQNSQAPSPNFRRPKKDRQLLLSQISDAVKQYSVPSLKRRKINSETFSARPF